MAWFLLAVCLVIFPNQVLVNLLPKGPAGLNFQNIALLLLLMPLLTAMSFPKQEWPKHWPKIKRWALLYLVLSFLALYYAVLFAPVVAPFSMEDDRLKHWRDELTAILMFFVAARAIRTESEARRILFFSVLASLGFVLYYLAMYYPMRDDIAALPMPRGMDPAQWADDQKWMIKRIAGVFEGLNSNEMAAYYVYAGVLFTGIALQIRPMFWKILLVGVSSVLFLGVVYSESRGAMLSAVAAFGYLLFRKKKWLVRGTLALVLIGASLQSTEGLDESAGTRLVLWKNAVVMGIKNPLGVGYQCYVFKSHAEYGLKYDTHNFFFRSFAELGALGFALVLAMFLGGMKLGWLLRDTGRTDFTRGLGLGCALMWATMLVCNMFGDRISYLNIGAFTWTFTGITVAMLLAEERERVASTSVGAVPAEEPDLNGGLVPAPAFGGPPAPASPDELPALAEVEPPLWRRD